MESSDDTMMSLLSLSSNDVSMEQPSTSKIPSNSAESDKDESLKIKINKWVSVATWHWCANDENCGICRMAFDACCPECKFPGDDCALVWGQCQHCYHMHCIIQWLNSQQQQQSCPMCRQEWKFKE